MDFALPEYASSYNDYMLMKFTAKPKYQQDFLDGKLFFNELDWFAQCENPGQGDYNEGSSLVENIRNPNYQSLNLEIINDEAVLVQRDYSKNPEAYKRSTVYNYSQAENRKMKIICFYASFFNSKSCTIQDFPQNMNTEFGNYCVLILDRFKFFDRLLKAFKSKPEYNFGNMGFVNYVDLQPGINEWDRHQQQWEFDTVKKKHDIEKKVRQDATSDPDFIKLFDEYCANITDLSRASLAEYVAHRKAVVDLFEQALETDDSGKYSKEARIHRIICPMQTTSDETSLDDMNLWLIDDRLAYHRFLASDKKINSLPVLDNDVDKRMDLAVFDAALSYTADPENINSITIVELKRPQRNDADNDPVFQVLKYVRDIKSGKIKKANGRNFGDVSRVSFYCYVIGDLTQSMRDSAESRGLTETQDKEGYFGFNPTYGAYVEVISYDKLLKDAKQRNRVLFDKLFEPKSKELAHPELIIGTHNV